MNVLFHNTFLKRFKKCNPEIKECARERIRLFQESPYHPLLHPHSLKGKWKGHYSINITGDYRAVFYYRNNNTIEFQTIDTHSNLYG